VEGAGLEKKLDGDPSFVEVKIFGFNTQTNFSHLSKKQGEERKKEETNNNKRKQKRRMTISIFIHSHEYTHNMFI